MQWSWCGIRSWTCDPYEFFPTQNILWKGSAIGSCGTAPCMRKTLPYHHPWLPSPLPLHCSSNLPDTSEQRKSLRNGFHEVTGSVWKNSVISPIVVLPWDLPTLMALIWGYYRNWDWCNSPDTLKWYPRTCYPRKTWTRPFHLCWAKATPNRVPGRYHS